MKKWILLGPLVIEIFIFIEKIFERHDIILICHKSNNGIIPEKDGVVRGEIMSEDFIWNKS